MLSRLAKSRPLGALLGGSVLALGLGTGCDSKGFIDPGEMGRYDHEPLTLKILDRVDTAYEEPNVEFLSAVPPTKEDQVPAAVDYEISKNDLIQVEISDLAGPGVPTQKQTRVSESGNISLPFIRQVKAEGYTEAELEDVIRDRYRTDNIVQNAQVSVTVVEARGRAFSILGAVARPGQYAIFEPDFRVIDALVVAGEQTSPLLEDLYIIRRTDLGRHGTTRPAGAAPGGATPPGPAPRGPATGPATVPDDLAPRTMAPRRIAPVPGAVAAAARGSVAPRPTAAALPARRGPVVHLQAADPSDVAPAAPGAAAAPAGGTAPGNPGDYIYVEGKPVYVGPATNRSTTPARVTPGVEASRAGITGTPTGEPSAAPPAVTESPTGGGTAAVTASPAAAPLARAGGSTGTASGGFEFNDLPGPENIKIIRIPLQRLRNGELQYNIVIRPKDQLIVQNLAIGEYYMGGHIARPGAYSLTQRRITLKQAVIAASMLDGLAIPERTDIIRRIDRNHEVFVRVNLAKVFAGQQSDLFLKPDDQVMVGTNALAPFLAAARGAFRLTYGFGFLYDRNFAVDENFQR